MQILKLKKECMYIYPENMSHGVLFLSTEAKSVWIQLYWGTQPKFTSQISAKPPKSIRYECVLPYLFTSNSPVMLSRHNCEMHWPRFKGVPRLIFSLCGHLEVSLIWNTTFATRICRWVIGSRFWKISANSSQSL